MKIVSSTYHDYYDSALVHHDNSVIYLRIPVEIKIEPGINPLYLEISDKFKKYLHKNYWYNATEFQAWEYAKTVIGSFSSRFKHIRNVTFTQFKFLVIFCGKIYPGIIFTKTPINTTQTTTTFIYDESAFFTFLSENKISLRCKNDNAYLKKFFSRSGESVETEFLINNKITNVILQEDKKLLINPQLSKFGFYKVFDVYSCYQELEMWMSGVLAYPQNMMIEVEDKIKVTKHGFDFKYGFRKRPR